MTRKNVQRAIGAGVTVAGALAVLIAPALGEERAGRAVEFTTVNGVESTRNATLTPGGEITRTQVFSDLGAAISSRTATQHLVLSFGARARMISDDTPGADEGADLGNPRFGLNYDAHTSGARLRIKVNYDQQDIGFLNLSDLVTVDDTGIIVADDVTDVSGLGTRDSLTFRATAQFGLDRPFGWGVTVTGADLSYSDMPVQTLQDNTALTAAVFARADLSPALRLDARLGLAHYETDGGVGRDTTTFNTTLTAIQSDRFRLRGTLGVSDPDTAAMRSSLTAGFVYEPNRKNRFSLDIGAAVSDDFENQFIGRLNYAARPSSALTLRAALDSQVTDTTERASVLNSAAVIGATYVLSPLSSVSFDAIYVQEEPFDGAADSSAATAAIQFNRQIGRDWMVAIGAKATRRKETGLADADSESLFFNIGRSWNSRF
ncbi:MAG: hypothetical protein AAF218_06505 [Pseudomonadota bacterium]